MDKPTVAVLLIFLFHLAGIAALFWLAISGETADWRRWLGDGGDGGGGGGGGGGGEPSGSEPDGPRGGAIPRPDAEQSALRLRTEHERLAGRRRRSRRERHAPEPARRREPV